MCGLTGFCDFNKRLTKADLETATACLRHRGPDSGNTALFETPTANVGFGHRRLSILDVSEHGNQPMYSDDGSVCVILNGEVYNFKEIRKELEDLGHSFHSDSDTEVIVKAYQQWGITSVNKFIGMFVYAIYDSKKQLVFILRDRPGVKPLYYYHKNNCLMFASELKAIYSYPGFEKNINSQAVTLFFNYGYIRAPHTIFQDTYKVQPGHYLKVDLAKNTVEDHKYWDVVDHYNKPKLKISEQEAEERLEELFKSAFLYRMVSDVPVGMFLSGGYDSSLVTGMLQKYSGQRIKTFTIGFREEKWNEANDAKRIAEYLGTDHHEYYCSTKEAQDIFPELADIYDEPFGDSSGIPTTLVSRFARKHVTVSLSADGGDEIFAGYPRYDYIAKITKLFNKTPNFVLNTGKFMVNTSMSVFPKLKKMHKARRVAEILNTYKTHGITDIYSRLFNYKEITQLLPGFDSTIGLLDDVGHVNGENDFINKELLFDYRTYMVDDILTKVDRATMSVGLEGREPLLDHRIIEFAAQLPSELKYNNGQKKYLLKKITHKYIPKELMDRPKSGFTFPMQEWLTGDLKHYLFEYINEEQLGKHNLIDAKTAIAIRDEFLAGGEKRETQMWLILMFQMWWNRWMS